ncbi:MAG: FG-GAP-like repeat-containing protein [Maribacter sp.]
MTLFQPLKFPQNIPGRILLYFIMMATSVVFSQTTFTESAASYGLNIGGNKDGGHAWSDFDDDGDLDVLILENVNGSTRSYLMQNNSGSFTNVRGSLVPGMTNAAAERQAAWGDLNGDGRPDFMITSHGNNPGTVAIQIYIQNVSGTFGDGIGGTTPITVGENSSATITINPLNVEGAGFFDFEGDGDLDIFFDSHNFGIELLRNNFIDHVTHSLASPTPAGMFTHITPGNGTGFVEFGLNQFATDGDYGSAADVNDDGWVDIFMRKRDENDFFLNQGGTFTNGADLAQADNGNKGGNGLWDLDNDGDLDAVWTENGLNQIFRNDGPGVWTPLGAGVFPSLPQPANANQGVSSAVIDAIAGGDVDNDGDIDILFVGDGRSYLYINQLNSPTPAPGVIGSGTAMTFSLDAEIFNSGQRGQGTTMIDIDDDGDLDIYMNVSGVNRLYINDLPAANRNNHLIIDVTEDRGANGSTGGVPERVAIGTNVLIRDCNGNIISGLRQVNGVFGHGTQSPEEVHFGLPLGEGETYVIEVRYPNFYDPVDGFKRLVGTIITTPSTIPGTNHYSLSTTEAEMSENVNAPDAVDDFETVAMGTSVSVSISLFDNDSEPDSEAFFISNIVQPAIGSVVIDDAELGLVTYTYSAGTLFPGTTFDYTISDSPVLTCPALGKTDNASVTIYEPCTDSAGLDTDGDGINDTCDLDDDNDGILDTDEGCFTESADFSINRSDVSLSLDNDSDGIVLDITSLDNSFNISINGNQLTSEEIEFHSPIRTAEFADGTFYGGGGVSNIWSIAWNNPTNPDTPLIRLIVNVDGSVELFGSKTHNGPLEPMVFVNGLTVNPVSWNVGINTIILDQIENGNTVMTGRLSSLVQECPLDTDGDGLTDNLDLDADKDGIPDNVEAQTTFGYTPPNINDILTYAFNYGVNTAYLGGLSPTNTDGTDTPDFIDTNADNEGANDTTEAGITLSGVDTDSDGLDDNIDTDLTGYNDPGGTIDDPLDPSLQLLDSDNDANTGGDLDFRDAIDNRPDNDLDGIVDALDFDDDNDGILDTDEGCGNLVINPSFEQQDFSDDTIFPNGGTTAAGTFIGLNLNTNVLAGWNYTQNLDGWIEGQAPPWSSGTPFADAYHGIQFIDVIGSNSQNGINNTLSQTISTEVGETYIFSFFWGEDIGHAAGTQVQLDVDVVDSGNVHLIDESLTNTAEGIIATIRGPKKWYYFEQEFTATTTSTTLEFLTIPDGPFNGAALDFVSVTKNGNCQDTDNDGIDDAFDLDSDNDGIYDAVEAGHGQLHTDGLVNGAVGSDGVPNAVQNLPNEEVVNYSLSDSDNDTNIDAIELDSDDDGCNDVLEAGYSDGNIDGLLGPNPVTVDGDGLVTSGSDGYTSPSDNNLNSTYDFQEAGAAPSITSDPNNLTICPGCNGSFSVVTNNSDSLQWQVFNGSIWVDLTDSGIYSGTTTTTLNITNASPTDNGNQYRVLASNSLFICSADISEEAILTVNVSSVITNRRITYRVKKN